MVSRIRPSAAVLIFTIAFFLTHSVSAADSDKAGFISIIVNLLLSGYAS